MLPCWTGLFVGPVQLHNSPGLLLQTTLPPTDCPSRLPHTASRPLALSMHFTIRAADAGQLPPHFARSRMPARAIPPQYKGVIDVDESTMTYWPHVWFNEFWMLRDHMVRMGVRGLDIKAGSVGGEKG